MEVVGSTAQEQVNLWIKQGFSDERHWKREPSKCLETSCTGYEQEVRRFCGSVISRLEHLRYPVKLGHGPEGGTTCLVMGLVFKTSRAAARVVAGGFDSHVPPPVFGSNSLGTSGTVYYFMRNNEPIDDRWVQVLARLKKSGADRIGSSPTALKADQGLISCPDHIPMDFPGRE